MIEKYNSLIKNDTWVETFKSKISIDQKTIDGKWTFRLKQGPHDEITQFKAHYVAKRFQQQYKINYNKIYASVVKPIAFHALFAIAVYYDLDID